MKYHYIILAILVVVVAGCSNPQTETLDQDAQSQQPTTTLTSHATDVKAETHTRQVELRWQKDRQQLFPATIDANEGEIIALTFMFEEPHFMTLTNHDLNGYVKHDTLRFSAKKGIYELVCQDCEGNPSTILNVK